MTFEPPRYEWEASDVREALELLGAAKDMINAHMAALVAGQQDPWQIERGTPVKLAVSLDLSGVVERVNDRRTVDALAVDMGDVDLGGLEAL